MHVAAVAWHGGGGDGLVLLVRDHMFYELVSLQNALSVRVDGIFTMV